MKQTAPRTDIQTARSSTISHRRPTLTARKASKSTTMEKEEGRDGYAGRVGDLELGFAVEEDDGSVGHIVLLLLS